MPILDVGAPAGEPGPGVCTAWATEADMCNSPTMAPEQLDLHLLSASNILFNLTGRTWPGSCQETVRPCGEGSKSWCGCGRGRTCGCRRPSELRLGGSPITAVTQVKVDGAVLSPDLYRVDDRRYLVYRPAEGDARQGWPCCQDVLLDDTEPGTFSVTYTFGRGPDVAGVRATAALARELALACIPETSECRLPERVQTVTRQGFTFGVIDNFDLFPRGQVGVAEVDMWVQSVWLGRKRRRATAFRPGSSRRVRRTGT